MLNTVDENESEQFSEPTTFRGRLRSLAKSSTETEGLVFKQDRRKSSTLTLYVENGQPESPPGSKLYETYADFYLRTKRTGSLAVPSSLYTNQQQKELKKVFHLMDLDEDEYLNQSDLEQVFNAIEPGLAKKSNIEELIKEATLEEDEKISFGQFKDYFGGTYFGRYTKLELIYVFNMLDKDMDEVIGHSDLEELFGPVGWNEKLDIDKILEAMDYNRDGRVCFEGQCI